MTLQIQKLLKLQIQELELLRCRVFLTVKRKYMNNLLAIHRQCQNVNVLTGAGPAIYAFQSSTIILPDHGMTYQSYTQKALFQIWI